MKRLLVKAQKGDRSAEQEMFQFLLARFNYLARQRVSEEEAQDIAQDACLTILKKYRTDAPQERFMAWAYKVLRSKIGNYYQHRAIHRRVMADIPAGDYAHRLQAANADPETRRKLIDCIKRLTRSYPRFARVLNLVYQGYSTREICEQLGIKPGNLYVILGRGRKLLSECLDNGAK